MSYKKYNWEQIAKDFNSPLIRNYIWVKAFHQWPKLLGIPVVALGIIGRKNAIEYIADLSTWLQTHEVLKKRVLNDSHYLEELIDKTDKYCRAFNDWSEKNIFDVDLKSKSGSELVKLLKNFIEKQSVSYAYGVTLPILEFQGFSFIEENLIKFLKSKLTDEDYQKYFRVFTESAYNSFAQDQEEDLLKLMEKFYKNKNWKNDVRTKNLDELKKLYPKFYVGLKKHTQKHAWVYYVYAGPAYTEQEFLNFIQDYLNKSIDPERKLRAISVHKVKIKKLKQQYIKQLKPDKFNLAIINLASKLVWAKPRRKDYQSKSYYHFEKLMREIARRLNISLGQARSATVEILENALIKGKEIDLDKINSLHKLHICLPNDDGTVSVLYGKPAEQFNKHSVKREIEKDVSKVKEVKGTCAYTGHAKGIVKIVNQPSDMGKMRQGDILVSTATTPSIVFAMKKAAAIVTDEGGLTCHAAIVSRELGIPCVIGTKIATQILKDGDMVEVDAEKGIVRKIH